MYSPVDAFGHVSASPYRVARTSLSNRQHIVISLLPQERRIITQLVNLFAPDLRFVEEGGLCESQGASFVAQIYVNEVLTRFM